MLELKYPIFDGEKVWDGAAVTIENGVITSVTACDPSECDSGFLMPGLIDAHTHLGTTSQELVASSHQLEIVSSAGMAMGVVVNPKGFVDRAAANGAQYIKVLLFHPLSIGKPALRGIVKAAHKKGLKVAVHATELATVRQAVETGADILLHVPMKKKFPKELAESIAAKGIAVAPTLVMMESMAVTGQFGFEDSDYHNGETAVKLLRDCGVAILAGTDANPGSFTPSVDYGSSIHREMELLVKAGLTPVEVLTAATGKNAETFGLKAGRIEPEQPATMLLVDGRPDQRITDTRKIKQVWINGKPIR